MHQGNVVINDQSNRDYCKGGEDSATVKFETKVIKSNLYDYSDAYILVTGNITATGDIFDFSILLKLHLKLCSIYEMHNSHKR